MSAPTVTFSTTAALDDWSAFQKNSYLARVDFPDGHSVTVRLPQGAAKKPTAFWREAVLNKAIEAAKYLAPVVTINEWPKPVLWRNVFGDPVDVENIDKVYALNILMMHVARKVRQGYSDSFFKSDELTQKLRETILNGREPNQADNERAKDYNAKCREKGIPLRAPVADATEDSAPWGKRSAASWHNVQSFRQEYGG